ncbi:MAG: hypothetical protein ACKOAW_00685, partial [Actinomycetota bacterium]
MVVLRFQCDTYLGVHGTRGRPAVVATAPTSTAAIVATAPTSIVAAAIVATVIATIAAVVATAPAIPGPGSRNALPRCLCAAGPGGERREARVGRMRPGGLARAERIWPIPAIGRDAAPAAWLPVVFVPATRCRHLVVEAMEARRWRHRSPRLRLRRDVGPRESGRADRVVVTRTRPLGSIVVRRAGAREVQDA